MNNLSYISVMHEYKDIYLFICNIVLVIQKNEELFLDMMSLYQKYNDDVWIELDKNDVKSFLSNFNNKLIANKD